ncbi:SCO family protein [Alcanivorax marinus]|uniref:SCO family protein n=1 Tax=Alloalcanivorax marinus TaxID=1177169 RepID=A0A9Q3UKX2_9GAMM|nr:SCO family protein [Alloalcanivorax marinus]MCC4307916.1 SCO family protein [Alloalcanivorax marinus]MCU5785340.1 electron transport protein SCO1/SenC [Alloalcanivorax marinus]
MVRKLSAALLAASLFWLAGCGSSDVSFNGKDITGLMPDLAFSLTGAEGETVTEARYQGEAVVLFFGYTHCPDFCPTTLTALAQALNKLSDQEREQLRVLFVSVDPERDTPELLAKYTAYFSPRVDGLTGDQEALRALTKRYRTTYSYEEPDKNGNYLVNHGLAMYGFDRHGKVRLFMRNDQPVEQIAEDLRALVSIQ